MKATLSISKLPLPVTSRLDAVSRASARETRSTPAATRVRPVKVLAPESVNVPAPSLFSAPEPELGPLPLITPAKLPSPAWFTVSPPVPALPSRMCAPTAPDKVPMDCWVSLRSRVPAPVKLRAPRFAGLTPERRSVPASTVVPPA